MPRSKEGVKRVPVNPEALTKAVHAVLASPSKRISLREACKVYNVKLSTLARHLKTHRATDLNQFQYVSKLDSRRVFTNEEEILLVKYIETIAKMRYGMSKLKVRQLAYKFAKANYKIYPKEWDSNEVAGESWMRHFMKRQNLSVRKAEAISKGRTSCFNKVNVDKFYDNLENVHKRFGPFPASKIYNLDETGVTTVQNPGKIVVPTNTKDVATTTSAERGQLITMIGCISATGNHIPPMLIFPRVNFKEYMMTGAPPGSTGRANKSGWSTETTFSQFLDHFISHVKPSKEDRVLLVMDNHETHLSVEAIEKAAEHGIVMVTFPPHTSHKLQPLDVSVYGPFKTYYNRAIDTWLANNPGKSLSIYNVAEIVGYAFPKAFSISNICSGFKATGISPLDRNVWSEADFLGSYSTDRPAPVTAKEQAPTMSDAASTTSHAAPTTSHAAPTMSHAASTSPHAGPTTSHAAPTMSHAASTSPHAGPTTSHAAPTMSHAASTSPHAGPTTSHAAPTMSHAASITSHTASTSPHSGPTSSHASSNIKEVEVHALGEIHKQNLHDTTTGSIFSPASSAATQSNNTENNCIKSKTPEQVQPFPKAGERKEKVSRKLGKTRIITDTPERDEIKKQKERKNPKKATEKKGKREPIKVARTLFDKIKQIKIEIVCYKCQLNFSKHDKKVKCIECKKYCHRQCVPKEYEFLTDEDDEFVCPKCKAEFQKDYSDLSDEDSNDDDMYSLDYLTGILNTS